MIFKSIIINLLNVRILFCEYHFCVQNVYTFLFIHIMHV